jgi:hypothetical protein
LIGALIPDSLYCKEMESKVIESLLGEFPQLDDYFEVKSEDDVRFLAGLQMCHDLSCNFNDRFAPDKVPLYLFKEQLMENLKDFAEANNLKV